MVWDWKGGRGGVAYGGDEENLCPWHLDVLLLLVGAVRSVAPGAVVLPVLVDEVAEAVGGDGCGG